MYKQIGTKRYDTETATRVAEWNNHAEHTDELMSETLYRKLGGEYFLHCEGGAQTRYAQRQADNEWTAGELIVPLTYISAIEWAQEHMSSADAEIEFNPIRSTDAIVRISAQAKMLVDREATASGRSIKDVVESCILSTLA